MLKILFHGYFTFILDFITDIYLYWISGIKNKRFCFEILENFLLNPVFTKSGRFFARLTQF